MKHALVFIVTINLILSQAGAGLCLRPKATRHLGVFSQLNSMDRMSVQEGRERLEITIGTLIEHALLDNIANISSLAGENAKLFLREIPQEAANAFTDSFSVLFQGIEQVFSELGYAQSYMRGQMPHLAEGAIDNYMLARSLSDIANEEVRSALRGTEEMLKQYNGKIDAEHIVLAERSLTYYKMFYEILEAQILFLEGASTSELVTTREIWQGVLNRSRFLNVSDKYFEHVIATSDYRPADADTKIKMNPILLQRAIGELLKNAHVHNIEKEDLEIFVEIYGYDSSEEVYIVVTDNGKGIPEKMLQDTPGTDRQRLFALGATTKEGRGVGLAEAWYIIKDAGGTISVDSELGGGTTFSIRLPVTRKSMGLTTKDWEQIEAVVAGLKDSVPFSVKRDPRLLAKAITDSLAGADRTRLASLVMDRLFEQLREDVHDYIFKFRQDYYDALNAELNGQRWMIAAVSEKGRMLLEIRETEEAQHLPRILYIDELYPSVEREGAYEAVRRTNLWISEWAAGTRSAITEREFKELHKTMLRDETHPDLSVDPGLYRRWEATSNYGIHSHTAIGLGDKMGAFFERFNQQLSLLRQEPTPALAVEIAAGAYYELCMDLHPFNKGNERIARLVMNVILGSNGLPVFSYRDENFSDFQRLVRFSTDKDEFITFLATQVVSKQNGDGSYPGLKSSSSGTVDMDEQIRTRDYERHSRMYTDIAKQAAADMPRAKAITPTAPFTIGVGGGTRIGKSATFCQNLKRALEELGYHVAIFGEHEFIKSPEERVLITTRRSADNVRLSDARAFLSEVKSGGENIVRCKCVRNQEGETVIEEVVDLEGVDIVIFEGRHAINSETRLGNFLEFIDFPIYMRAGTGLLEQWRRDAETRRDTSDTLRHWRVDLLPDLSENIAPSETNARVVVYKFGEHRMGMGHILFEQIPGFVVPAAPVIDDLSPVDAAREYVYYIRALWQDFRLLDDLNRRIIMKSPVLYDDGNPVLDDHGERVYEFTDISLRWLFHNMKVGGVLPGLGTYFDIINKDPSKTFKYLQKAAALLEEFHRGFLPLAEFGRKGYSRQLRHDVAGTKDDPVLHNDALPYLFRKYFYEGEKSGIRKDKAQILLLRMDYAITKLKTLLGLIEERAGRGPTVSTPRASVLAAIDSAA